MRRIALLLALLAAAALRAPASVPASPGFSLRFHGNGTGDVDRVKVPIDPPVPADVGATDFTLEFWMKALDAENENGVGSCFEGGDNWITGNIVFDRDVYGAGDYGDYGVSLYEDGLAFGVAVGGSAAGLCGDVPVDDGVWHHVAVTRAEADGTMRLFVDGSLDSELLGPAGDASYRDGRPGAEDDPFLVIGAEKHDAGPAYPSYSGWVDEVRISSVVRYVGPFSRPSAQFDTDAQTAALYHFDEGGGDVVGDSAPAGASDGVRMFGGSPPGPEWSTDTPLAPTPSPCDLTGTAGDDVLVGTDAAERICGLGGDDRLIGGSGDDVLTGGPGRDRLRGQGGRDRLRGGPGRDRLWGGSGHDRCPSPGPDRLTGCP